MKKLVYKNRRVWLILCIPLGGWLLHFFVEVLQLSSLCFSICHNTFFYVYVFMNMIMCEHTCMTMETKGWHQSFVCMQMISVNISVYVHAYVYMHVWTWGEARVQCQGWLWVWICVWKSPVCVRVYVHVHVFVYIFTSAEGRGQYQVCTPITFHLAFWDGLSDSTWNAPIWLHRLTSLTKGMLLCLPSQCRVYKHISPFKNTFILVHYDNMSNYYIFIICIIYLLCNPLMLPLQLIPFLFSSPFMTYVYVWLSVLP